MFRALLCPSSGAHDDSFAYHYGPSGSRVAAGWRLSAGRVDECPDRRLLQSSVRTLIHPTCT